MNQDQLVRLPWILSSVPERTITFIHTPRAVFLKHCPWKSFTGASSQHRLFHCQLFTLCCVICLDPPSRCTSPPTNATRGLNVPKRWMVSISRLGRLQHLHAKKDWLMLSEIPWQLKNSFCVFSIFLVSHTLSFILILLFDWLLVSASRSKNVKFGSLQQRYPFWIKIPLGLV